MNYDINYDIICQGDLEELKKIPKRNLTNQITKTLLTTLETNIQMLKTGTNNINYDDIEMEFLTSNYVSKRRNMEKCIEYLQKIK